MTIKFEGLNLYLKNGSSWIINDTTLFMDSGPLLEDFKNLRFTVGDVPATNLDLSFLVLDIYDNKRIDELFGTVTAALDCDNNFNETAKNFLSTGMGDSHTDLILTSEGYAFSTCPNVIMPIENIGHCMKYIFVLLYYVNHVDIILLWCINKRIHPNLVTHLLKNLKPDKVKANIITHLWAHNEHKKVSYDCVVSKHNGELLYDWITYTK